MSYRYGPPEPLLKEIGDIAATEGRKRSDVVRLLIRLGLRAYRRRGSLLCELEGCRRKDCCGSRDGEIRTATPLALVVPMLLDGLDLIGPILECIG